jgi:hypothetical protein
MASVLALYRRSLVERTKHHLGMLRLGRSSPIDFDFLLLPLDLTGGGLIPSHTSAPDDLAACGLRHY